MNTGQSIRTATEFEMDPRVDLAVERTELALERTHLSWIRTMFTLISAGIAIDKAALYVHEPRVEGDSAFVNNAHTIGIFLTSIGTVLLLIETIQYIRRSKELAILKKGKPSILSTATILSLLVLLLGCVLLYVITTS